MSLRGTYIHGTEPREQKRLAALNHLTNQAFVRFLQVPPGAHVLELGSGLGPLAAAVAGAAQGVTVVGIERASEQLAAAIRTPHVTYVQGDAHHLGLRDGSFDLVYTRYVLEHVHDPERVVAEMRRVARPGARVAACENDVSLVRMDPPCPTFETVWLAFQEYQARLGGDSQIGRRLYRLFHAAHLSRIELSVQPEVHWHGSPGFAPWVRNIIGNIESARTGLVQTGGCDGQTIDRAVGELERLLDRDDASAQFVWNRVVGIR